MDLKPNYHTNDKDASSDPIVFPNVHAYLIMRLRELTQYPLANPFAFEDSHWSYYFFKCIMENCIVTHLSMRSACNTMSTRQTLE